jgi:hypothetical protein
MEINKMEDINAGTNINIGDVNANNTNPSSSNPFVDAFKEMNNTSNPMMNMFSGLIGGTGEDEKVENIGKLYEVLTKLSNTKEGGKEGGEKELSSLFEELLEFLLKSETLSEPLSQIKSSVLNYLDKNKDKLSQQDEEKYKSMINNIDTILLEISKPQPNKQMIIDIFYKLNEITDFDSELLKDADPSFKEFSQFFKK